MGWQVLHVASTTFLPWSSSDWDQAGNAAIRAAAISDDGNLRDISCSSDGKWAPPCYYCGMKKAKPRLSVSPGIVEDLVAASRILASHGVLDAYGHVSARSDREPGRFVMSRSLAPALVEATDLMELEAATSEPVAGETRKAFLERYIHGEIFRARPDVNAIVHSHSPSVIPFGVTKTRLRPVYHMAGFL